MFKGDLMRKYIILSWMAIFLILLTGCKVSDNSIKDVAKEDINIVNNSGQPTAVTDWSTSTYETVNGFDGVTMTVKEGTITPTNLILVFKNSSSSECAYGEFFSLEKKINEVWYQVPVTIDGDYGFHSIGYGLSSGDHIEYKVDWNWLYGSQEPGEYRIIKDILDFRGTGDFDKYYLAAEFILENLPFGSGKGL